MTMSTSLSGLPQLQEGISVHWVIEQPERKAVGNINQAQQMHNISHEKLPAIIGPVLKMGRLHSQPVNFNVLCFSKHTISRLFDRNIKTLYEQPAPPVTAVWKTLKNIHIGNVTPFKMENIRAHHLVDTKKKLPPILTPEKNWRKNG
ncbi:hypothetical protein [Virgibacillus kimchii]